MSEKQRIMTGQIEEVFSPNDNLRLISKKGKGGSGSSGDDPRKRYFDNEEELDEGSESEKEGQDKPKDGKDKKEGKPDKKPSPHQGSSKPGVGSGEDVGEQGDLEGVIEHYKNALEEMIEEDERQATIENVKEEKRTADYQERRANVDQADDLMKKLQAIKDKEPKKEKPKVDEIYHNPEITDEVVVKKFQELEAKLAPYAEQMARDWLEIINNIAADIEVFKDKYYRSGKPDIKKLQRLLPEIELGKDIETNPPLIFERIVEKIIQELRPRALRVLLLIDNSGSMGGWIDAVRMAVMLINQSLQSLRILFRDRMRDVLGSQTDKVIDIMVDLELWLFGDKARKIRPFLQQNLTFLRDPKAPIPPIDINGETMATLIAFKKVNTSEGTYDQDAWLEIKKEHQSSVLAQLIKDNMLTEVIFQVSDGDIRGDEQATKKDIDTIRALGIPTIGMAIGAGGNAASFLARRHGSNVMDAETPKAIVEQFAAALKKIVQDSIEKPFREILQQATTKE